MTPSLFFVGVGVVEVGLSIGLACKVICALWFGLIIKKCVYMKRSWLVLLFGALSFGLCAQNNVGVVNFEIGEKQFSKKYFEEQVAQNPGESYYYLGEIAFAQGNMDDATSFYEQGIAAAPTYMLNYVGRGKLLLKSNPQAAELAFGTALKVNKKDVAVLVAIARAYFECGMKDMALAKLEVARKFGKKSPLVYTFEGDVLQADQKWGEAAGKYDQAVYFDPNYVVASLKYAQVYSLINAATSLETLKKIQAAHPEYTIVYRELGRCYGLNGQYQSAIEAYKTYFAEGNYTVDDIVRFASAYYFTDQYSLSQDLINQGLKMDSTNFVLNRLRMYNASKIKDAANGLSYAAYFFGMQGPNATFIPLDYMSYASILTEAGQYEKALECYKKVLETESGKPDVYKELFTTYSKMGDNAQASESYRKYIALSDSSKISVIDYYQLGRSCYAAGLALNKDSSETAKTQAQEFLLKADTAFSKVCVLTPDSYTGYLWRGHTNAALDPETTQGLAKPYYEAAVDAILKKSSEVGTVGNKKDLIIAYRYLGYYYYVKEDEENAIKYWSLVLELDPNNALAKQVLDSYKNEATKK